MQGVGIVHAAHAPPCAEPQRVPDCLASIKTCRSASRERESEREMELARERERESACRREMAKEKEKEKREKRKEKERAVLGTRSHNPANQHQ